MTGEEQEFYPRPSNETDTQVNDRGKQFVYFFRQTNNKSMRNSQVKENVTSGPRVSKEFSTEFGLGEFIHKSNKGCLWILLGSKFPISGDAGVSLPPGMGRVPFMWESHFLLSGGWEGLSVLPAQAVS